MHGVILEARVYDPLNGRGAFFTALQWRKTLNASHTIVLPILGMKAEGALFLGGGKQK
jgi:hypothetical protein